MVNLCLDIGNTRTKLGYFKDSVLIKVDTFMEDLSVNLIPEYAKQAPFDHMIISSVRILNQEILKELSKSYSVIVVNTNMTPTLYKIQLTKYENSKNFLSCRN